MLLQTKLKSLVKDGDLINAQALIEEAHTEGMPGLNAQKFNWLVHAYVQARQPVCAASLVERMEPVFRVKPTQRTFAHLVDAFAAIGDVTSASAWYDEMQRSGFDPDIRSLNNLIKAWCRSTVDDPDLSVAETWLRRIDALGIQPDSHTYGNLIFGAGRRRNLRAAVRWFEEMQTRNIEPCLEVCTVAFDAAAAAPEDDRGVAKYFAEMIFDLMRVAGLSVDVHCWNQFVRAVGYERAQNIWENGCDFDRRGDAFDLQDACDAESGASSRLRDLRAVSGA